MLFDNDDEGGADGGDVDDGVRADWDAAGETAVIYLKMKASGTYNNVQVGDIVLNYLAKF